MKLATKFPKWNFWIKILQIWSLCIESKNKNAHFDKQTTYIENMKICLILLYHYYLQSNIFTLYLYFRYFYFYLLVFIFIFRLLNSEFYIFCIWWTISKMFGKRNFTCVINVKLFPIFFSFHQFCPFSLCLRVCECEWFIKFLNLNFSVLTEKKKWK